MIMLSLFKNDLKQLKHTIVIYAGCLLLSVIISFLSYYDMFSVFAGYFITFVFSLIVPIINLKYLFSTTQQTHFNSLPFTRKQSFMIHYLSGIICLIIPALIYCILVQGVVLENSAALFLMIFIYYTLANLTAYLTTSLIMDLILQVVIILSPLMLYYSLTIIYVTFIKGIVTEGFSLMIIGYLIPLVKLLDAGSMGLDLIFGLVYLGYLVIIFILAFYVCIYRQCSNNYFGFTYKSMAQIIKFVIIISASWMLASILGSSPGSIKTFIMIDIIATVIVTFIIHFIQYKKIKFQLCLAQAAIITIGTVIIFIFSKNYLENYIPNSISGAVIENRYEFNSNSKQQVTNRQDIDKIINIHKRLINEKEVNNYDENIRITYYRLDGSKVVREYGVGSFMFKEITKELDQGLIKSWNGRYYELLKKLDKYEKIELDNNEINKLVIEDQKEKQLLKDILKTKLTDFETDLNLVQNINYDEGKSCGLYLRNDYFIFMYYENDPLSLALEDFYKIKAN